MNHIEPTIHVGILSAETIEFVLDGTFVASNGKMYGGKHHAEICNGKVLFDHSETDEIIFVPTENTDSFELLNVVIGINFHWERKENQRFKGALKLIVENLSLIHI